MTDHDLYKAQFRSLRCCVLIPTYNNATTLATVVKNVMLYSDDICIVNDGSTDDTLPILKQFSSIKLCTYEKNKGKGWALRTGFEFALNLGYDYAITIDSDGQHYADDLPVFLQALMADANAIFIGSRNMNQSSVPGKSSFGNKFSNFWFRFETGIDLPDTQSGYRLYPIRRLEKIHFFTYKYEFEVEVIVRAAWSGINVKCVPVKVYYPPAGERITHFRPFRDFSRISVLNTALVFILFVWIKPRNFVRYIFSRSLRALIEEHLIKPEESAIIKAFSVAVGIFFGIAPLWGLQLILALAVAWLLRLNKGIALIASNISIPPMIPILLFMSYETGGLVLGRRDIDRLVKQNTILHAIYNWMSHAINSFHIRNAQLADEIAKNVTQYIVGSFALATLSAVLSGFATYLLVKTLKKN
jgi:glycosyltransferase involved in cell wall biosynthesis